MIMYYPKLVESKTGANKVSTIEWNPGMDLFATVFTGGTITCTRSVSMQKVWLKPPSGQVASISWRPDGKVLAIASRNKTTEENVCNLYDVEDGKEINSIITGDRRITSIAWHSCSQLVDDQNHKMDDPIKSKKINPIPPPIKEHFSHELAHEQDELNMLMIATDNNSISLYALGLFHLGEISVECEPKSEIVKMHMSKCMRYISIVVMTKNSTSVLSSVRLIKLNIFQDRSDEILRVAKMYAKITDELDYIDDTLSAITTSWTDVLAGLDTKLSSYLSRQRADKSAQYYTFITADELLQLLVVGITSDSLERFLADMSDKGLKKLNLAIEQTCIRVQNLIVKNAQKCCHHLHSDLNMLRGMALWRDRFSEVGLDDKSIIEAMKDVGSLVLKLTELQQVIDHSLKSTKSFFRWLISVASRLGGELNNSLVSNESYRTTQQDTQLITDFILENFDYNYSEDEMRDVLLNSSHGRNASTRGALDRPTCSNFTLEQVGQYFKNEPLSRLKYSFTKPGSNFWIDFFKQRPELSEPQQLEDGSSVLLFYPHNTDTSLVQEHKRTRKSVGEAFKAVAANIKLKLEPSGHVSYMKDFVRNAPTERIRVETDIRCMRHYTIFQLKAGLNTKHYLISQSLVDQTFKLISIEFQTASLNTSRQSSSRSSASASTLSITDSSFYHNRDLKKLLVTFLLLDQTLGDSIIVQIEINKLFDHCSSCPDRNLKDTNKIFRTNDTIEKQSSPVVLKLDLNSQPADKRRHEPKMMVKRVKRVSAKDLYSSDSRNLLAITSRDNKRLHLFELELAADGPEIMEDEVDVDDEMDESLIDTEMMGS